MNSLLASIAVFVVSALLIASLGEAVASIVAPLPMYTFGGSGEEIEKAWNPIMM